MTAIAAIVQRSLGYAATTAGAYSAAAMNALVVIGRKDQFNAVDGEYLDPEETTMVALYDDPVVAGAGAPAGIALTAGPITTSFGDEPEYYDSVTIYIRPTGSFYVTTGPTLHAQIDDLVKVISAPDPAIAGRTYRIISATRGGRVSPSVRLTCEGVAPSKQAQ